MAHRDGAKGGPGLLFLGPGVSPGYGHPMTWEQSLAGPWVWAVSPGHCPNVQGRVQDRDIKGSGPQVPADLRVSLCWKSLGEQALYPSSINPGSQPQSPTALCRPETLTMTPVPVVPPPCPIPGPDPGSWQPCAPHGWLQMPVPSPSPGTLRNLGTAGRAKECPTHGIWATSFLEEEQSRKG